MALGTVGCTGEHDCLCGCRSTHFQAPKRARRASARADNGRFFVCPQSEYSLSAIDRYDGAAPPRDDDGGRLLLFSVDEKKG